MLNPIDCHCEEKKILQIIFFCMLQKKMSYRFVMAEGAMNNDRIVILSDLLLYDSILWR